MRLYAALIAALAGALLLALPALRVTAQTRDRIEVVDRPGVLFYSLEDGGQARFRSGDREDWTFTVTHEEYIRIRELLEPYRAEGHACDDPKATGVYRDGYLLWRDGRGELRRPNDSFCYTPTFSAQGQNLDRAYRQMSDWGRARWTPPPGLPAPTTMTLVWRSWGNRLVEWTLPRGGEGRYVNRDAEPVTFPVSEEQFDRFRALFAPYEGVRFECRRVLTDGAYGSVVWSQPGHADQSLNFDAGCVSGDAADVFQRLEQAETMLDTFRNAR